MHPRKIITSALLLLATTYSNAQFSTVDFSSSLGTANYFGDLNTRANPYNQSSFAGSVGLVYYFADKFNLRADIGYSQLKADDKKSKREDLKARNLNFRSNVIDFNVAVEYDLLDISTIRYDQADHVFTPYAFAGVGLLHFDPTTVDRYGNKVHLQAMGTEGQGLADYPDRKPYSKTALQIPFGGGVKFALSKEVTLSVEFKYHLLFTDYLDDVSREGYPTYNALYQKDHALPGLTYRGDELPGGGIFPYTNAMPNRGNPKNNDAYYNTLVRFSVSLN